MDNISYKWQEKGYRVNHRMVPLHPMMLIKFSKVIDNKIIEFNRDYIKFRLQLLLSPLMGKPQSRQALITILSECIESLKANQPVYKSINEDSADEL
jgi:hypothetical protein